MKLFIIGNFIVCAGFSLLQTAFLYIVGVTSHNTAISYHLWAWLATFITQFTFMILLHEFAPKTNNHETK